MAASHQCIIVWKRLPLMRFGFSSTLKPQKSRCFHKTASKVETFQNGGQRLCKYKEQNRRFTNELTSQLDTPFRIPWERKHLSPDMCFAQFSIDCRKQNLNASMDIHSFVAVFVIAKTGGVLISFDNTLVWAWP